MKILIVGGFLGSGKTSFILQLAHYMAERMNIPQIAILENEIGEFSVDDRLIRGAGYEVRGLFSGCVCCSMAGELPVAVHNIEKDLTPEWLIIEATGVAFPGSIKKNIEDSLGMPCRICTLADAKRWKRIFHAMEQMVRDQLECADVILVNKTDLVDKETLENVLVDISEVNDTAEVLPACANEELPEELFGMILGKE